MRSLQVFLLLVATRGGNPVDLADGRYAALEGQKASRDEQVDAACQKTAQLFVVGLQEELGRELQFHLLPVGVGHRRDAGQRVVAVRGAVPISRREPVHLVALAGAEARGLAEVFALNVEYDG